MARDFDGVTDRIDYTNVLDPADTAWTACFTAFVDASPASHLLDIRHSAGAGFRCSIDVNQTLHILLNSTGGGLLRLTNTSAYSEGQFNIFIFTHTGSLSASDAHIYINGAEATYSTTDDATGSYFAFDQTWAVGGRTIDDTENFNGRLGNLGFWTRVLSASERAIIDAGFEPAFIPNGLVWAPKLIRSAHDPITGQAGTLDGTTVIEHPRTILRTGPVVVGVAAAEDSSLDAALLTFGQQQPVDDPVVVVSY